MFCLDPSSSISSAPRAFTPSVRRGIGIEAEDFRLSPTASSDWFSFHLLHNNQSLLRSYWSLRRSIFCTEQLVFQSTDRDELDQRAYPIAALHHGNSPIDVVGVVRIVETQPHHWFGGRLGVHRSFRSHNQIGKGLIWKAVTTANGWGCQCFQAAVQIQNVRFFQRLHWSSLEEMDIHGIRHHLMQADLNYYTASAERRPAEAITA